MAIGESKNEVRNTWMGFTVIFAVFGSISLYKGRGSYPYFYSASLFFAIFAAAAPMVLLPLYRLWIRFAMFMGWVNTRLILGLVFFLIVTPLGLAMRLMGKDVLDQRIDKTAATYWKKKTSDGGPARYEKSY